MEKKYFIQESGVVSQAYSLDDLRSKNIAANTLVCVKFGDWKAAKDIPEVAELLEWQPTSPSETNWTPPPPQVQNPNMQQFQQQPQPQLQTIVIAGLNRKSTGVAFLLSFFFGPLGLFYASVTGGLVMLLLSVVIGIFTLGIGLVFTWIGCIIWAMVAVNKYNENLNKPPVVLNQQQQPNQQQYSPHQQPNYTQSPQQSFTTPIAPQPPEQSIKEQPLSKPASQLANFPQTEPLSQETTPPPDISEQIKPTLRSTGNFITQYKIPLIISAIVIAAGLAGYNLFLKKDSPQTAALSVSKTDDWPGGDGGIENAVQPTSTGYIQTQKGSNLRLRSQPSEQAPVIANVPNGMTVSILGYSDHFEEINGEKGKWCNIIFNGKIGWAWGGFIKTNTLTNPTAGLDFNMLGTYNNKDKDNIVNLRENPDGKILKVIPIGETFYYMPSNSEWCLVKTKDGLIGYIKADRIQQIK